VRLSERWMERRLSSQASVAEFRNFEEFLHQQIVEGKGKEAAVKEEIKKIETYLDADQIKRKQIQQYLEDKGQKIHKI